MSLPADWRDWASSDPAEHPEFCGCLLGADESPTGYPICTLALDAHQWLASAPPAAFG